MCFCPIQPPQAGEMECQILEIQRDSALLAGFVIVLFSEKDFCGFLRTDPAAAGSSNSSSNYHLLSTDTPDLKRGTFLPDLLKSPINLQVGLVVTLCSQGN